ncbi:MAG: serine/threonine protein kinase [Polyangiaceae bacterium]|nr:serine/threonine protein kinase [Polyangiaceae bacterium]
MTPALSFPQGAVIAGKYRVERVLGQGGMGIVIEATHVALGQRVAMKLLAGEGQRSPEALARFIREGQIAARLPAEHVARVTDVGQTEQGEPFLVMEFLDGRDLAAELAARGRMPVEEAVSLILQACEGVAEAHALGLVHRDIKPANLFLTRRRDGSPRVKVLDFGLTKVPWRGNDALTQTAANFGTPLYMSPEQIQSAKHVDARTDQHALAMVLFELLTERPPYIAESATALTVAIATQPPPSARALRPEVPEPLDAAIRRALGKWPDERFPDLAGFAAALAPFGGAQGQAAAAAIRGILGGPPAPATPSAPEINRSSVGTPSEQALTAPLAETSSPFTSSMRLHGLRDRARARARLLVAAAAGIGAAALLVVALVPSSRAEPLASGIGAALPPILAKLPRPPAASPDATAAPAVAPAPTAAPTSTARARSTGAPAPAGATRKPKDPRPEDVFSDRGKTRK